MSAHTPDELRKLLDRVGLSQRAAARKLQIDERNFRKMCAGTEEVPEVVILALRQLALAKEQQKT